MQLPETLVERTKKCELIAATNIRLNAVKLKSTCPKDILSLEDAIGVKGVQKADWLYINPERLEKYRISPFYVPTYRNQRVLHQGAHLFLRDTWARYKRVDNYLQDIFFFKPNRPENKPKPINDSKTSKSRFRK